MIETIWPLSILSCPRDPTLDGKDQNLIGLRTFVQEVLRRSKTSYSTLQVALYYLVLIRSCVPKHDFTMEQLVDSQSCRAMQCGRRMFLAALILASKYLQDRNFSARAWSKISGLKTLEINTNEMAFLSAVNWKLHIPESVFNRWTDIVLRFSPTSTTASQVSSTLPNSPNIWKSVIPHLTPDLDSFEFGAAAISGDSGYSSSKKNIISRALSTTSTHAQSSPSPQSSEQTRNDTWPMPDVLEPAPHENDYSQNLPSLPRLGLLPTPVLTPQTGNFSTPAAGTFGFCNRRSSMSVAMAQVQSNCLARSTLDNPNHWKRRLPEPFPTSARRSSLAQSVSSLSSPESMISDVSSRSSRSSSISSVASSTCALPQPPLAVQVTRRCAKMQISGLKGCSRTILRTSPSEDLPCEGISTSPDALPSSEGDYFTRPNRPLAKIKSKDPADRAHCNNASAHEAAAALRDLALSRHWMPPYPSKPTSSRKRENPSSSELSMAAHDSDDAHRPMTQCSIAKPRKRERLCSSEMSVQSCVRELMAPCYLGKTVRCRTSNEDDSTVLPDRTIATSFLVSKNSMSSFGSKTMPMFTKDDLTRERSCAAGASMEDSQKISRLIKERAAMPAPGMWEGII